MPISSISARRLDKLLTEIVGQPVIGLDLLREIASQARAISKELDDPAKRVVAWTLMRTVESLCDKYDADPMTAEDSASLVRYVRGPVQAALWFLDGGASASSERAVVLVAQLIDLDWD